MELTLTLTFDLLILNKCKCYATVIFPSLWRPLLNAYESWQRSPNYTYLTV